MRPTTITIFFFVVFFTTTNAQLTILPQIGLENTSAKLHFNGGPAILPAGSQTSPAAGMRLEYQFKGFHGPYLGFFTSRSTVDYSFTEPENGMNIYQAKAGDMQLRLEAGYQVSTRAIYLNRNATAKASKSPTSLYYYHGYSGRCSHSCGRSYAPRQMTQTTEKDKGMYVKLQPSIGAAYIPSVEPDLSVKTESGVTTYHYLAGNWNTAVVAGLNVEFGKNTQKAFNLGFQYLRGIGNLGTSTIHSTSMASGKEITSTLSSEVSGWNLKAGIPLDFGKKKPAVKAVPQQAPPPPPVQERRCQQYRKCSKVVI